MTSVQFCMLFLFNYIVLCSVLSLRLIHTCLYVSYMFNFISLSWCMLNNIFENVLSEHYVWCMCIKWLISPVGWVLFIYCRNYLLYVWCTGHYNKIIFMNILRFMCCICRKWVSWQHGNTRYKVGTHRLICTGSRTYCMNFGP